MLRTLFRKQFAEIFSLLLRGRRGKTRTKATLAGYLGLFALILISIGASFYFLAQGVVITLGGQMSFLYYFVMGIVAVAIGLLGSVFGAYATIFRAKDNDLLLSLPIPSHYIIFTRVVSISIVSMIYQAAVLVPAFIVRVMTGGVTPLVVINYILLFFLVTMFVIALSLALAFVVAVIAGRVKHKSLVTVVTSLVMVVLYYVVYFKMQSYIAELATMTEVPAGIKKGLFLFYYMGLAAEGDVPSMAIFASVAIALFALAYFLLSHFFIRLSAKKRAAALKGREGVTSLASPGVALFKREWRRYLSNPNYILNCSLGSLLMLVAGVFVFIKSDILVMLAQALPAFFGNMNGSLFGLILVLFIVSMNYLTAPSISLEGKTLWVLRTLPVSSRDVFAAKVRLHLALTMVPALFLTVALAVALRPPVLETVMMFVTVPSYVVFTAFFGLTMNLMKPMLDWKSEIYAIKQSPSVLFGVMGEYAILIGLAALYIPLSEYMKDGYYMIALAGVILIVDIVLGVWLSRSGVKRFEELS